MDLEGMEHTCHVEDTCEGVARVAVEVASPCRLALMESWRSPVEEDHPGERVSDAERSDGRKTGLRRGMLTR